MNFKDNTVQAVVEILSAGGYMTVEVESVYGFDVERLDFLNIPLTLKGKQDERFAACALSLNLKTNVDQLPVLQTVLSASCHSRFGMRGAKVAVVLAPMKQILPLMKTVLSSQGWDALFQGCRTPGRDEIPFNHGSYLFNFGSMTESNIDDWITMAKSLGVNQIDNHGGGEFFRFGDFGLNEKKFPDGWDSFKRMVDKLHSNGINAIFHTYAFFIDKRSPLCYPGSQQTAGLFPHIYSRKRPSGPEIRI